ncbi:MAG TPA: metalloregulator ArsR/SmtB family transcription factor [Anaerolineae bacterium]
MDAPRLIWDVGTAYDLFISLDVLHNPARYGLRGSWAAGVRSRLPVEKREFLQEAINNHTIWVIPWLATQPGPKDSATVLQRIAQIPPRQRLLELNACHISDKVRALMESVLERGAWDEEDREALRDIYQEAYRKEGKKKKVSDEDLANELTAWANAETFGEKWLAALRAYYDVFFAEEEARIRPALEATVEEAKELAERLALPELLEELSQGLRFDFEGIEEMQELTLIPSFWTTPLSMFTPIGADHKRWLFLFGGRPADVSLVPGEVVPELLFQTLKALADPTRLRILRYLTAEPLTPAQLARRLRLRPPTVIHHLDTLRLARLVHVTLSYEGRRYEVRREAVAAAFESLETYLDSAKEEKRVKKS